jgi:16S rRNA (cytosine967-C5)-methyltransferase
MTARLVFTESPRTPHLFRIWKQLQNNRELPQVDRWLAQVFRGEKRFGKKDRQWYADAVFAALRLGPLVLLAEKNGAPIQGDWSELRELPAERLFHWLSLERQDPADERFLAEKQQFEAQRASRTLPGWGLPPFFTPHLDRRRAISQWTAKDTEQFLAMQNVKAPLWLRVNLPAKAASARRELQEHGIAWSEEGNAWKLEEARNLQHLQCIEQGVLEIQDYASQLIGAAIDVSGEPIIWDSCAGGGGKTLQIAARLQGRGQIIASDIRSYKLEEVQRRAARAGFSRVRTLPWNGETLPALPALDAILIDAPCTGTGTWRRSPDSKYRCQEREINELQALQISLFQKVLPVLKKGGQLIYATCSWLVEENEDVVAAALKAHPDLHLESQKLCGNPAADADTMFYAVLRKL